MSDQTSSDKRLTLISEADAKKYAGQYITVADENSKTVLCHGDNAEQVYVETQELGYTDPIILFVLPERIDFVHFSRDGLPQPNEWGVRPTPSGGSWEIIR